MKNQNIPKQDKQIPQMTGIIPIYYWYKYVYPREKAFYSDS